MDHIVAIIARLHLFFCVLMFLYICILVVCVCVCILLIIHPDFSFLL